MVKKKAIDTPKKSKTLWQYISPWFDKQYYALTTFAIFGGMTFLFNNTNPSIKSKNDLLTISGKFSHYSLYDDRLDHNMSNSIWLDNYKNEFRVKADFMAYFKSSEFKNSVSKDQVLYLTIAKQDKALLNTSSDYILIFSIDSENQNFLDDKNTVESESSNFKVYAGLSFIIIGIIYYFVRRYLWTP